MGRIPLNPKQATLLLCSELFQGSHLTQIKSQSLHRVLYNLSPSLTSLTSHLLPFLSHTHAHCVCSSHTGHLDVPSTIPGPWYLLSPGNLTHLASSLQGPCCYPSHSTLCFTLPQSIIISLYCFLTVSPSSLGDVTMTYSCCTHII